MSTDSMRQTTTIPDETRIISRMSVHVRRFICSLHGHDSLLHFDEGRLSLLCSTCGHESPGWEVKGTYQREAKADATPHVVRLPLVGTRRVA